MGGGGACMVLRRNRGIIGEYGFPMCVFFFLLQSCEAQSSLEIKQGGAFYVVQTTANGEAVA